MILLIDEFGNTWTQPCLYSKNSQSIDDGVLGAYRFHNAHQIGVGELVKVIPPKIEEWIDGKWRTVRNREEKGEEDG